MRAKRIELKFLPEVVATVAPIAAIPAVPPSEENPNGTPGVPAIPGKRGSGDAIDYKKMLLRHLENAPSQGLTLAQMKTRLALIDSLQDAADAWELDHKEHTRLAEEFAKEKWTIVSQNLVTFLEDFQDAPDAINPVVSMEPKRPVVELPEAAEPDLS